MIIIIITIIIIVVVIKRMNLYRVSQVAAESAPRPRCGNVDALFLRLLKEVVKKYPATNKRMRMSFLPPPPIVATSQRIWTSSSTVGDAIKKSPGPHQSMGGRFYKDGRTDGHGQNRNEKVKIALRSAIAQRTFSSSSIYLFIFRRRFFMSSSSFFCGREREKERKTEKMALFSWYNGQRRMFRKWGGREAKHTAHPQ